MAIARAVAAAILFTYAAGAQESLAVRGDLHGMVDDYLTALARKHWQKRDAEIAALHTPAEVRARQEYVRSTFIRLMGGFPEKTPLNPRITGTFPRDGYRVDRLIFESRPQFFVTADLYVPTQGSAPYPAVLGLAGHSDVSKADPKYQRGWIALAKRGFIVLAFDPPGQGERTFYFDSELGRSRVGIASAEHTHAGLQCFLTGATLAQYVTWDGIRSVDYLLSRKDVDPERIGVAGNSGGGMQSAYLAAVEPRLSAAAPSCYMTSSEDLWRDPGPQDAEQNVPGFLSSGLNLRDFALAFAPKAMEFMTATRDFFPIQGARDAFAETKRIYQIFDRPDSVKFFEYDDTHGWSLPRREETYSWFERWLKHSPEHSGKEPDFREETTSTLNASATGQVATSLGGETVPSLNAALAHRLAGARNPMDPAQLRTAVAASIALDPQRPKEPPAITRLGSVEGGKFRIEKLVITTEPGITLPALLFLPAGGATRRPAVLYLDSAGKAAGATPGGDIEALANSGRVVLAPDLRGDGETENRHGAYPHNGRYQTSLRALLVGKTMPGMRTLDVLRCFDYLRSREDVNPTQISLLAKGNATVPALLSAALEPRIAAIACEDGPVSYLDLASLRFHGDMADLIIPGVLKDFDLPDLLTLIAPRPAWIVDPRMPSGAKDQLGRVRKQYEFAVQRFQSARAPEHLRILERPEGWPFALFFRDWLTNDGV